MIRSRGAIREPHTRTPTRWRMRGTQVAQTRREARRVGRANVTSSLQIYQQERSNGGMRTRPSTTTMPLCSLNALEHPLGLLLQSVRAWCVHASSQSLRATRSGGGATSGRPEIRGIGECPWTRLRQCGALRVVHRQSRWATMTMTCCLEAQPLARPAQVLQQLHRRAPLKSYRKRRSLPAVEMAMRGTQKQRDPRARSRRLQHLRSCL